MSSAFQTVIWCSLAQLARVAFDRTLCASKWNVHDGAFPRRSGSHHFDFVEINVGRKTHSPFAGTQDLIMDDANFLEQFDTAIIHADRDRGNVDLGWRAQEFVESAV